jgi:uncharacterized protein YfeS
VLVPSLQKDLLYPVVGHIFFWSCSDELGLFGSDEGDTTLAEYRNWRPSQEYI